MISRIEALLAAALPPLLHLIQSIFKPLPFFDCFYCSELFYSVTDITNKVNSLLLTSSWSLSNLGWCPLELALQINPIATRLSVDHTATDGNKKSTFILCFNLESSHEKKMFQLSRGTSRVGKRKHVAEEHVAYQKKIFLCNLHISVKSF